MPYHHHCHNHELMGSMHLLVEFQLNYQLGWRDHRQLNRLCACHERFRCHKQLHRAWSNMQIFYYLDVLCQQLVDSHLQHLLSQKPLPNLYSNAQTSLHCDQGLNQQYLQSDRFPKDPDPRLVLEKACKYRYLRFHLKLMLPESQKQLRY